MERLQAILFDLDGTLVDSLPDLAASANRVLARMGFPEHPEPDYPRFIGRGVETLMERALPCSATPDVVARAAELMCEDYAGSWADATIPFPEVPPMLADLKRAGLKLAVISNKPHEFTVQFADQFFPSGTFDAVLGATADLPHKPDPAMALEVAKRLGLSPEHCALVGDSGVDMRCARGASMTPAAALWGYRSQAELEKAGAAVLFESPSLAGEKLLEMAGHGRS